MQQIIIHTSNNTSQAHTHTAESPHCVAFVMKCTEGKWPLLASVIEADFHRSCGSIQRAIFLPNGKPITAI